jgi:hypothetical protein
MSKKCARASELSSKNPLPKNQTKKNKITKIFKVLEMWEV